MDGPTPAPLRKAGSPPLPAVDFSSTECCAPLFIISHLPEHVNMRALWRAMQVVRRCGLWCLASKRPRGALRRTDDRAGSDLAGVALPNVDGARAESAPRLAERW